VRPIQHLRSLYRTPVAHVVGADAYGDGVTKALGVGEALDCGVTITAESGWRAPARIDKPTIATRRRAKSSRLR
jgi:hypothetical protein